MPPLNLPQNAAAPAGDPEAVVACDPPCSDSTCCHDICCDEACQPSYWKFDVGVGPTQLHLTDSAFGRWPNDTGTSAELDIAYENPRGYGIRGSLWTFGQNASPTQTDVQVTASSVNLDFYKRFWGEDGDLAVGISSGGAALNFRLPNDRESRFVGGGIGLFSDGFFNLVRFEKSDLGLVGRGRVTLLEGDWSDNTGSVVNDTDHDSMMITELGTGLEYRRRFGRSEDKYWRLAVLTEFQRWDSEWMGNYLGSAATFSGLNVELGVAW
jgi:hypothetical protein